MLTPHKGDEDQWCHGSMVSRINGFAGQWLTPLILVVLAVFVIYIQVVVVNKLSVISGFGLEFKINLGASLAG